MVLDLTAEFRHYYYTHGVLAPGRMNNGGQGAFMEDIMMNYTVEEAAKSFEEKFKANGFKRSVLPNNAPDYTSENQVQEIEAVRDFLASDMLEYIANLT